MGVDEARGHFRAERVPCIITLRMRLHHLALRTDDVPRLLAFYQDFFGLAIVRDHRPRSVWLGLDGPAVVMIEAREGAEPTVPAGSMEFLAFAVSTDAREALRARLVADGRLEAETANTLYFRDPDGRRVGVSTYPLDPGGACP